MGHLLFGLGSVGCYFVTELAGLLPLQLEQGFAVVPFAPGFCVVPQGLDRRSGAGARRTCLTQRLPRCRSRPACSSPAWPSARSPAASWASQWSSWPTITTTGSSSRSGVRSGPTASPPAFTPWSARPRA